MGFIVIFILTDALQAGASQFEASAGKLKNKYWWKNMKVCMFSYLKTLIGFNFLYDFC